jgi:hypothetical protein
MMFITEATGNCCLKMPTPLEWEKVKKKKKKKKKIIEELC